MPSRQARFSFPLFLGLLLAGVVIAAAPQLGTNAPPGRPQDPPTRPAPRPLSGIEAKLAQRIPQVNWDHAPLEDVLRWVEKQTGAMVYARWGVLQQFGIDRHTPVSLRTENRKLSHILWVILQEASADSGVKLAYEASDELILVSSHEDLSRELVTYVYDVQTILHDIPHFDPNEPGKAFVKRTRVNRGGRAIPFDHIGPLPGDDDEDGTTIEMEIEDERQRELVDAIYTIVEPDSWSANGRGGRGVIFPYRGKLIVRNSLYVHQQIGRSVTEVAEKVEKAAAAEQAKPPPAADAPQSKN